MKNKQLRNSLINKLNAVVKTVDEGNYSEALAKLQEDILAKTNGCADTGQPDSNDWIISSEQQQIIYQEIQGIMEDLAEVMNRP